METPLKIDHEQELRHFILNKSTNELSNLSGDCYYPKIITYHRDLLNFCNTTDIEITKFSKSAYGNPKWILLHDPKNVIFILLCQHFLKNNDVATALACLNMLTLKFYTGLMFIFIKHCNPKFFKMALSRLSKNHLFNQKSSISNSLLYLSKVVFSKFLEDLKNDSHEKMYILIYQLRSRLFQSIRALASKYYESHKAGESIESKEPDQVYDISLEQKINILSDKISKDIALYQKIDRNAINVARELTKFNWKLSSEYAEKLCNTKHMEQLKLLISLLLKSIHENKTNISKKEDYIKHIKKLMSIKFTNKPIYFKQVLTQIHDELIKDLNLTSWFNKITIQARGTSRSYLAYYISLLCLNYFSRSSED